MEKVLERLDTLLQDVQRAITTGKLYQSNKDLYIARFSDILSDAAYCHARVCMVNFRSVPCGGFFTHEGSEYIKLDSAKRDPILQVYYNSLKLCHETEQYYFFEEFEFVSVRR